MRYITYTVTEKKSNSLYLFLGLRIAAIQEDLNQADAAIKTLEGLVGNKTNLLKDKIHFDLVRLYVKKGDTKTATERFKYLKENHSESQFVKLSKFS